MRRKQEMKETMRFQKIWIQFYQFILISGLGFLMDFGLFYFLTKRLPIAMANMISALPAITWVFFFSTRKIFRQRDSGSQAWVKYGVYLVYQCVLLVSVSVVAQKMYTFLYPFTEPYGLLRAYLQMIVKCLITPITMLCNFIVMKTLAEKA